MRLNDYETDELVYLKWDRVISSRQLVADGDLPKRTRIDTDKDTFLVSQTLEEIKDMQQWTPWR